MQRTTFVRLVTTFGNISAFNRSWVLALFVWSSASAGLVGQSNPFDLVPRLPESSVADTLFEPAGVVGNPFDVVPPAEESAAFLPPEPIVAEDPAFSPKPVVTIDSRYRRVVLIVTATIIFLLTILVTLFRAQLGRAYRAFQNDNLMNQLQREREGGGGLPYYLFYALFLLNAGFLLFLLTEHYDAPLTPSAWRSLGWCVSGITAFFLGKHLLLTVIRWIFPVDKEVRIYNLTIVVFNLILGLGLVVGNSLLAFGPEEMKWWVIRALIGLIGGVYLFMILRSLLSASRFIAFHKFHFLLYICTVEIAPVLILVRLLMYS